MSAQDAPAGKVPRPEVQKDDPQDAARLVRELRESGYVPAAIRVYYVTDGGPRARMLGELVDVDAVLAETGTPSAPVHDPVNHPSHYTAHPSGVECIEITRHMHFNLGNAIKYIWRAGEKGDVVQDLEKAIWYLRDEIVRLGGEP